MMTRPTTMPSALFGAIGLWLLALLPSPLAGQIPLDSLYRRCEAHLEARDYAAAVAEAAQAQRAYPDSVRAQFMLGRAYFFADSFAQAHLALDAALVLDSTFALSYYEKGKVHLFEGESERAAAFFQAYIRRAPQAAQGHFRLASIYERQGRLAEADSLYNLALALEPALSAAYLYRGRFRYQQGDYEAALADANQAVKLDSGDEYAYYLRADVLMELAEYARAERDYGRLLALDPAFSRAYGDLALAQLNQQRLGESIATARQGLSADSSLYLCWYALAWAQMYQEDYAQAEASAREGIGRTGIAHGLAKVLAYTSGLAEDYAEALRYIGIEIEAHPAEVDNYQEKAEWLLLHNTAPDVLDAEGLFRELGSPRTAAMDRWLRQKNHRYYWPRLREKFGQDYASLGADEYFMLYYGQWAQPDYQPYAVGGLLAQSHLAELSEADPAEAVRVGEALLAQHPFLLEAYLYTAVAYYNLGRYEGYEPHILKYNLFLRSILATGTGADEDSAIVVASPYDEYMVLMFLGLEGGEQDLREINGRYYDVLQAYDEAGAGDALYFDLDKALASMRGN